MTPIWNFGQLNWPEASAATNVVQVSTNVNAAGPIYWWRNELPGETLRQALQQFYTEFPFAALGCNVAACVADEFNGQTGALIQSRQFEVTTSFLALYEGD